MQQFIEIKNFRIFAYHGYYAEEQKLGNWFQINLKIGLSFIQATTTDDLTDTLNYENIFEVIKKQMQIKSRLLENVVLRISKNIIILDDSINYLECKIEKLLVPVDSSVESTAVILKFNTKDIDKIRKESV